MDWREEWVRNVLRVGGFVGWVEMLVFGVGDVWLLREAWGEALGGGGFNSRQGILTSSTFHVIKVQNNFFMLLVSLNHLSLNCFNYLLECITTRT